MTKKVPSPAWFINRELSWLEFNRRVLEEAQDRKNPILERLKFFCIVGSNLDEFFEVRVAGIKQQIESDVHEPGNDGLSPKESLRETTRKVRQLVEEQYRCWREELLVGLAEQGIRFRKIADLEPAQLQFIDHFYYSQVHPVLTPLAVDPAHPFPQLLNKSLNLIVLLEVVEDGEKSRRTAVVQVPSVLPRLVQIPRGKGEGKGKGRVEKDYVFLAAVIARHLKDLFPGMQILGAWNFRVTRNSELYIDEEEVANLLKAVENELHNRRRGDAVRLEVERDCPLDVQTFLLGNLSLSEDDLYIIDGPISPGRLLMLCEDEDFPALKYPAFLPAPPAAIDGREDLFELIREKDLLLHHPYESFSPVVDFLQQAARDSRVLAIKQTLYRTGGDPRIIGALREAVQNGKQVTAVVELRARFDEANNIHWARQLEESGVHVVYGLVGYKIHAKMTLVVRSDADQIRRYLHLSTGNYNPITARLYTDLGFFTCRTDFGEDATQLFNLLTGICQFQEMRKLIVAPFELSKRFLKLIEREAEHARQGLPARIVAKMNSLVDAEIILALYGASQAGVKVELVVRGICCLRAQVKGLSENITVQSVVPPSLHQGCLPRCAAAPAPKTFADS